MSYKQPFERKKYLREMISNQIKNVPINRLLLHKDLARVAKYISTSIFDEEQCCIWEGYITNSNKINKGTYINFFFKNRKVALHRLLYENFVGYLGHDYYLKYSCEIEESKGKCCNVNHMIKYKYNSPQKIIKDEIKSNIEENTSDDLTLYFD